MEQWFVVDFCGDPDNSSICSFIYFDNKCIAQKIKNIMNCTICLNEGPHATAIYNDCVIECLEKIKVHYMSLKKQLCENDLAIKTLKETTGKLEKDLSFYQESDHKSIKKRRTACPNDNGMELQLSQIYETQVPDKSVDDLNMALNDEKEFEMSFISNSPLRNEKNQINVKREPMKTLSSPGNNKFTKTTSPSTKNSTPLKAKRKDDHVAGNKENSKTSNWISKESELRKTTIGSFYKTVNTSLRHVKKEQQSNLSLRQGRLRQSRLQLHISKNLSNDGDSTFCDEAIEASPDSTSKKLHKSNSSRQWFIRNNVSDKVGKRDAESSFDISIPCTDQEPQKATSPKPQTNELETSSVVMLTPATQDIIFLDDSSESFNIESMDLLRDLMNPTESHMSNLRRLESNRIKLLQKTVSDKTECHTNKKENKELLKNESKSTKSSSVEKADVNMEQTKISPIAISDQGSHNLRHKKETPLKVPKVENQEPAKKQQRILEVDCNECQAYIKYLGANLSDEQIYQHIRNCTKHKKRVDMNLTPDGFWDPVIRPLSENDPRNITLIDKRVVKDKRS